MLQNITKVEVSGALFEPLVLLDLFNPVEGNKVKTVKGTILYGRNGSGKSTIAKGFRVLSGEDIPTITNVKAYDKNNQMIVLTDDEKARIFVFDEDYIDENVRLKQEHLDTIVMLGEAAGLTKKIDKATMEYETVKNSFEQQSAVLSEYLDAKNVKSPNFYIERLSESLRGDDNWAGRDRKINDNKQNTPVKNDTFKKFVNIKPSKSKTELLIDFEKKLTDLKVAKTGVSIIRECVPQISCLYTSYNDDEVLQLLSQVIEKPELNEREQKLLTLLEQGCSKELSQRLDYLRSEESLECPYCLQPINVEYKASLIESIEKVLSKIVDEHQVKLREFDLKPISVDLAAFSKLEGYNKCTELVENINDAVLNYSGKLKEKIDNPYNPVFMSCGMVKKLSEELVDALSELERNRIAYNAKVNIVEPIIEELRRINGEIAYYDVKDLAEQYENQQKEYIKTQTLYSSLKEQHDLKKKELEELEAKRSNVHLAVEKINACLQYIFFAEKRLEIEYVNGVYKLLSYGKSVKPCDVSVGERNIIALSYFFAQFLERKEEKEAYKENYLLVIDDPISSYDVENRIGILSFLKYKLSMFLEGNKDTKALVFTHDLRAFYDMHKVFEEIVDSCNKKGYINAPKFHRFELRDKELKQFSYKNRQEYTELVETVYKYANGQCNDYEFVIGNMMRQVLEAFSTFEYKKGIEAVSTDNKILQLLPEPAYVSYYKNLMYRLVLHGGSHKEEQVKTMGDFSFFSLISNLEKQRTAKDILCFIYLLNRQHVLEHLKNIGDVDAELMAWCQDIKSRAVTL